MRPLRQFPADARARVAWLFTDIDDTVTTEGRLTAAAYGAIERLSAAGIAVVPVTGRPAGWCDMIARFWPVAAVIGENGAFWFSYDHAQRRMTRRYWQSDAERAGHKAQLAAIREAALAAVPAARVAADQAYREADLAIDFAEGVGPLPRAAIDRIVAAFHDAGAIAKVSSIHVNGWFGDYDKLAMAQVLMRERFDVELDAVLERCVFAGDSPNDEPMFRHFTHSVGVANVRDQIERIASPPRWVTRGRGGAGFVELARALLAARKVR